MDLETSIRIVDGVEQRMPPACSKSPDRRADPVTDTRNAGPQSDDDPTRASVGGGADREERLLHFVDLLRSEQVRAALVSHTERRNAGFRFWRGLGLLLALAIVTVGAAAFLRGSRQPEAHPDILPDPALATASDHLAQAPNFPDQRDLPAEIAQPRPLDGTTDVAPTGSLAQEIPSPGVPDPSAPDPTDQPVTNSPTTTAAAAPTAVMTAPPASLDLPAQQYESDRLASPAETTPDVSEASTAKPGLWVYYPQASSRAEAKARILVGQFDPDVARSDLQAQADFPDDAVIKFSEPKNHALARLIGKWLGASGYRWKIEPASGSGGSHRNMIEVWLPR